MKSFLLVAVALVAMSFATPQASAICAEINEDYEPPTIDAHIDTGNPTNSRVTTTSPNGPLVIVSLGSC